MQEKSKHRHSYRATVSRRKSFTDGMGMIDISGSSHKAKSRKAPNVQVSFYNVGVFLRRGLEAMSKNQDDVVSRYSEKDLQTF